ncbi:selenide, water dikinase SelD [Eubacterium aggregans]|uniref:selenide, water dikinase SelD n=2 Tax=Eubacterium aggregans TaxID=81409 RepID=UPI003F36286A
MEETIKLTKLAKCTGCGAKVGAGTLSELLEDLKVHHDDNLIVGFDKSDDASVYKISDELALVQTLDFFPPIADDPYLFGQIAATNALSDVYAMGGEPKLAMNILCVTESMPREAVHEVLRGGYDKVYEVGAIITGGHSIIDEEPKYGLSGTGFVHPDKVLSNSDAKVGDQLILTKPLGMGILTTGAKVDMVEPENLNRVMTQMTTLNKAARDVMIKYRVHSCTDVTGFSLMGHGYEMAEGSDACLEIWMDGIEVLPQALELAEMGILPAGMDRNRSFCEGEVAVDEGISRAMVDVLFDPQTSGGLLMAVDPADAEALYHELQGQVPGAQWIGEVSDAIPGCKIKIRQCR